jgi:ribosomal protein L10
MKKEDKSLLIDQFVETLNEYAHFYLVDVTALNSATTSALRRECFKQEVKLQVVKNTLFEKALEKLEGDYSALLPCLKGVTGVMFCQTANVPAKLIKKFAKDHGDMPALKAATLRKASTSVLRTSMLSAQSRARTSSLPRLSPPSKVRCRVCSPLSTAVRPSTVSSMQLKRKTPNAA